MVGRTILHYAVLEEIGAGSWGKVYLALDERTQRRVALKFLHPAAADAEARTRLVREARAASKLSHPGIVTLYGLEEAGDDLFLVEEFVDGETLGRRLSRGPMGTQEVLRLARELAAALAHAHAHGVLHRDLKPENVLVAADGSYKIADFGIARVEGTPTLTQPGSLLGTLPYLAPECLRGHRGDHRSDLFSLGAVLYEAVTGRRAFPGSSEAEVLYAVMNEEPRRLEMRSPNLRPLGDLVERLLSKEPGGRPAGARVVVSELAGLERASVPAMADRRRRVVWVVAAVALALAGSVGFARWWRHRAPAAPESRTVAIWRFENVPDPRDPDRLGSIAAPPCTVTPRSSWPRRSCPRSGGSRPGDSGRRPRLR